jgi:hypothetical protein
MELTALSWIKGSRVFHFLVLVTCLALVPSATWAQIHLATATQPPSGLAGTGSEFLTGSGFPSGTITPASVTVSFASTCLATPLTTTTATQVNTVLGSTRRIEFVIPASLATGTYAVWVTDSSPAFTSLTCSTLMVTNSTKTLAACIPSSSLAVAVGTKVTAYVPNGCWSCGTKGIQVVPIEGGGSPTSIATPNIVNACSSNAVTGQTVCTANNTDVYLLTGTTLNTTLTSGSNTTTGFSGGICKNCGVAIDAAVNVAVIEEGFTPSASGSAFQVLNLANNAFNPPFPLQRQTSENISVDPIRNYILSPDESGIYDLVQIGNGPGFSLSEFIGPFTGAFDNDSAGEDCTTGIALSAEEFTNNVYVIDVTQAAFTPGSPAGTWTAPHSTLTMVTSYGFSAGTSGISVAPGSTHLGVVTGEFGGNSFAVLALPSTSGSGIPTIADYAVARIPGSSTCGGFFNAGLDPHTVTAYTSPNNGKAFAVFAGYSGGAPICLAVVDLAAVLAAPRGGGGVQAHDVGVADFPASAVTYFPVH